MLDSRRTIRMTAKESSYGYPAVPLERRRMLLVRYDLFPFMLVHQGHRLDDGSYRWVSGWEAGHQNLGLFKPDSEGVLAVMPAEEGEKLAVDLAELRNKHYEAEKHLGRLFVRQRDKLLAKYHVSVKRPGGKNAKEST
jgi:hypothetical protein